jgi:hypothetical protein
MKISTAGRYRKFFFTPTPRSSRHAASKVRRSADEFTPGPEGRSTTAKLPLGSTRGQLAHPPHFSCGSYDKTSLASRCLPPSCHASASNFCFAEEQLKRRKQVTLIGEKRGTRLLGTLWHLCGLFHLYSGFKT